MFVILRISAALLAGLVIALSGSARSADGEKMQASSVASDPDSSANHVVSVADSAGHKLGRVTHRKSGLRLDANLSFSEFYDNNIFDYSDAAKFMYDTANGSSPRFPIRSLSDRVSDIGTRVDLQVGTRRSLVCRVRLRYDARVYDRNRYRSYNQFGLELRLSKRHSYLELSSRYLPKYNLRSLYWRRMAQRPSGVRYAAADYSRQTFGIEVGARISALFDARINLEGRRFDYVFPV